MWVLVDYRYVGLSENGMGHYKHICKRAGEGEVMLRDVGKKAKRITQRQMSVCFAFVWDQKQVVEAQKTHWKGHTEQHDGGGDQCCSEGVQNRSWERPKSFMGGAKKMLDGTGGGTVCLQTSKNVCRGGKHAVWGGVKMLWGRLKHTCT